MTIRVCLFVLMYLKYSVSVALLLVISISAKEVTFDEAPYDGFSFSSVLSKFSEFWKDQIFQNNIQEDEEKEFLKYREMKEDEEWTCESINVEEKRRRRHRQCRRFSRKCYFENDYCHTKTLKPTVSPTYFPTKAPTAVTPGQDSEEATEVCGSVNDILPVFKRKKVCRNMESCYFSLSTKLCGKKV